MGQFGCSRLWRWRTTLDCRTSCSNLAIWLENLLYLSWWSRFFCKTFWTIWLFGPAGWGHRTHRLHLCTVVRLSKRMYWFWHQTIWLWGSSNDGALGNAKYSFIAIAPSSILAQSCSSWLSHMYGLKIT